MAERNSLISLDGFIHKYFDKRGVDDDEYHRYRIIACDCLKELSIHHMPVVKSVVLSINVNTNTAPFPDDYIDYVSLNKEVDGRWWALSRDDKLVDGTLTGVDAENVGDYEYNQGFAQPGGVNYYYYTPDYENRRFIFNGVTSEDVIVLKYKSTGVEVVDYGSSTDIQIPAEAETSLEYYIDWKVACYNEEPESKIARKKSYYDDSLAYLRRIGDMSIDELRQVMLSTVHQTTNR
jgi:hypothetical protein